MTSILWRAPDLADRNSWRDVFEVTADESFQDRGWPNELVVYHWRENGIGERVLIETRRYDAKVNS